MIVYFWAFVYQKCTTTHLYSRWHLKCVKQNTASETAADPNIDTSRQSHCHGAVAERLPHDDCSISVTFYGHCMGKM